MSAGKPLRFLGAIVGGWVALRAFALWPDAAAVEHAVEMLGSAPVTAAVLPAPLAYPSRRTTGVAVRRDRAAPTPPVLTLRVTPAPAIPVTALRPVARATQVATIPPPLVPPPRVPTSDLHPAASRWSGSAWLIARGGNGASSFGGQLGASQAGARLLYALDTARHVAIAARVSSPLEGRGQEAAIGIDWQPTRAALHLLVEQRVALDARRSTNALGGPTVALIGGFGPRPIAPGIEAEAYAQAGGIARDGIEGFADGAARVTHRALRVNRLRLDLGIGTWGGAQRGAARLDIGPTAGLVVPVGERAVRITLDWRRRVAGSASPGSGAALSIGSDF